VSIYLIRHGESEGNVQRVNQGRLDLPLTARGREQAVLAGRWLASLGVQPEGIYASPLRRAWETAEIIAGEFGGADTPVCQTEMDTQTEVSAPPIHHDPDVIEYHAGEIEGLSADEINARYPAYGLTLDDRGCFAQFGGESYEQMQQRLQRFIDRVGREHRQHDVIAIAHGGSLYQLLKLWCGWPAPRHYFTRIGNCTCFKLELREISGHLGAELQFMVPFELMERMLANQRSL
jgi:broad specificity phosphatase PhoE